MYLLLILFLIIVIVMIFQNRGIPIFLYHQVNPSSNVTPDLFEEHLKILKEKGMNTIIISDLLKREKPKNSVLLTLDDGYYDNYKYVFPLLKKYEMRATIFLNTLFISEKREYGEEIQDSREANFLAVKRYTETGVGTSHQYMSWEEIMEMEGSGLVDFQAHSHFHRAVFKDTILTDIFEKDEEDSTDTYLYGKVEEGYPKFRKRGEYSLSGVEISPIFFQKFKQYYETDLKGKDRKVILSKGQAYIDENLMTYVKICNEEDLEKRINEEFSLNKKLIESHLGNSVKFFCWPWGHKNQKVVQILKKLGVLGFVTTKKGTNSYDCNLEFIKRVELRDFSAKKFRLNLMITRNLLLGKIYQYLS